MKTRLGVTPALWLKALLYGLDRPDSPFELRPDTPTQLAIKLRERTENLLCAFLSPLDYARYSGEYLIVPEIAVSSRTPREVIQLYVKAGVRNVATLAVDPRVTSEIILAKILLREKFPNLASSAHQIQFVPMPTQLHSMLAKADAALIVNDAPNVGHMAEEFALDLVQEWTDLTDLPYVHGFWVTREQDFSFVLIRELIRAKTDGLEHLDEVAEAIAQLTGQQKESTREYLSSFSYSFGDQEQQSLSEYMRYAYFHGILQDIPEINFFPLDAPSSSSRN